MDVGPGQGGGDVNHWRTAGWCAVERHISIRVSVGVGRQVRSGQESEAVGRSVLRTRKIRCRGCGECNLGRRRALRSRLALCLRRLGRRRWFWRLQAGKGHVDLVGADLVESDFEAQAEGLGPGAHGFGEFVVRGRRGLCSEGECSMRSTCVVEGL